MNPTQHLTIDGQVVPKPPLSGHLKMGGRNKQGGRIEVNSRYLLKDGRPWIPVMGEFHYARYPREYWEESLLKMKAAKVSIVAAYVFWIHHEEIEGEWNWSGDRALRELAVLCARHDLYLFLRIGPWVHGECRNGGFPDWLPQRCPVLRDDHPVYLDYVEKFYRQIYRQIEGYLFKDGGPIIGVQLENEYGHVFSVGHVEHIQTLKAIARRVGFDVPLYTVTGWGGTWVPENEVLPALGGYPAAPWAQHTHSIDPDNIYLFQGYASNANIGSDLAVGTMRNFRFDPNLYPYITCETGAGNQATGHRRPLLAADDIASIPVVQLGSGVNLLGYYMFHGGTNPVGKLSTFQESRETGYPSDVPVLSCDYQAPIREYGQLNQSYRLLKTIHLFLDDFGEVLAPMSPIFPAELPQDAADADTLRRVIRVKDGRGFLFVNNYQRHVEMKTHSDVSVRISLEGKDIVYPSFSVISGVYFIWPFNMDLGEIRLKLAQAQLVCRVTSDDAETYVFAATPGVSPCYCFESASVQSWEAPYTEAIRSSSDLVVSGIQPGTDALIHLESVEGKKIQILTITHEQVGNLWKGTFAGQERLILTESDVMFDRGTLTLTDIKAERRFGVYPPPDEVTHHGQSLEPAADGIFPTYTIQQTVRTVDVRVEAVPTREHTWLIHLPDDALDGVNDVFLLLNVTCDKAFLYIEDTLVADHFYNGEIWEVGLKRFAEMLKRHPLKLVLAPLHEDTDIYLECKPNFVNGIAVALDGVEAIVQYQDNIA